MPDIDRISFEVRTDAPEFDDDLKGLIEQFAGTLSADLGIQVGDEHYVIPVRVTIQP